MRAAGPAGPLALIALQAAQVVLVPIPGQLTAGYLFRSPGLVYSFVGVTIGRAVGSSLARRFGRPYVDA